MNKSWHLVLTGITVLLALHAHRSLWVGLKAGRERLKPSVSPTFWALCACLSGVTVSGFASLPIGPLGLNSLPEHSLALLIAAAGLLGIRFCLRARMDA